MSSIGDLEQLISGLETVGIVIHRNPDGDAVGSGLALQKFFSKKNIDAVLISPNKVPDYLSWLPGAEHIRIYEKEPEKIEKILQNSGMIFTLDFNNFSRTGADFSNFLKTLQDKTFVMIDHHLEPDSYATFTFSDHKKSSTAEMVYDFMIALHSEDLIDKDIATSLYTGIMTDTGSFKFPNTTPQTMCVAADLMKKGIDHNAIQIKIYDSFSTDKLHLLGLALNKLVFLPEYKTAYIVLSQEELNKHHYKKGDTEGFVNYGLSLADSNFAVLFLENEDKTVRISFRSKGKVPANEFAKKYFNGGGHLNAAGGRTEAGLQEAISLFLSKLPEFKSKLLQSIE